jgi:N-acyl-phosphatidylethanolamine-hydrolysing phospholipase D
MTGGMTAAALYTCTMSTPGTPGALPEDFEDKKHHLKAGGFTNPWDSWHEMSAPKIVGTILLYA